MGKYPITQGQWKAVMDNKNPSEFQNGDDYPVENVSWDDDIDHGVQTFIKRLNKKVCGRELDSEQVWFEKTGGCYRLPTEAEWEYACRAGTKTKYFWGNRLFWWNRYAWYDKNSGGQTHPTGKKRPNSWGLYDMAGNVWEWVLDWYDSSYYGKCSGFYHDPANLEKGTHRVYRGGGWDIYGHGLRSAFRYGDSPENRYGGLGFRLVRDFQKPASG
jgi:formylglycine-generating enzyme required for sulfatase activity